MEDKTFELMEKMYVEMRKGFESINGEINGIKSVMATQEDITNLKNDIDDVKSIMATQGDIMRLEHKMDQNHKALFDGYKQNTEAITELKKDIRDIKDILETHEVRLKAIE